jgi:hypothetical protein
MATVPAVAAAMIAVPFWRRKSFIFGNLVGTGLCWAAAVGLILREYLEIRTVTQACLDANKTCWPEPSAFTRYAIYASVALLQSIVLFSASLTVERRLDNQLYAPEWRR